MLRHEVIVSQSGLGDYLMFAEKGKGCQKIGKTPAMCLFIRVLKGEQNGVL